MKPKVIVIGGPTASGKTALSIELAKKINGEIVSADSMQIYKDMSIGTAKPTIEEMGDIKHYMIDFVSPETRYSVSQYKKDATACIEDIIKKGKTPIVVGGTGLYINSLIYGIEYQEIPTDMEYRNKLNQMADEGKLQELYDMACKIDEEAMKIISPNDKKRIIRVLEIYKQTGKTKTEQNIESRKNEVPYEYIMFAINMERVKLYERINKRVDIMLSNGLIEEVQALINKYNNIQTAMQSLGYKEVVQYFNKELSKEEMIDKIKMESRRYAKRQLTWFRKNKDTIWLDGLAPVEENISKILQTL